VRVVNSYAADSDAVCVTLLRSVDFHDICEFSEVRQGIAKSYLSHRGETYQGDASVTGFLDIKTCTTTTGLGRWFKKLCAIPGKFRL